MELTYETKEIPYDENNKNIKGFTLVEDSGDKRSTEGISMERALRDQQGRDWDIELLWASGEVEITIEVNTNDVIEQDIEYNYENFGSAATFENWCEENGLTLVTE